MSEYIEMLRLHDYICELCAVIPDNFEAVLYTLCYMHCATYTVLHIYTGDCIELVLCLIPLALVII